LLIDVNIFL